MENFKNPEFVDVTGQAPLFDYEAFNLPQKVELDAYYIYHTKDSDLGKPRQLHNLLKKVDIHIPEQPEWYEEHREMLQKISNGDKQLSRKMTGIYLNSPLGNPTFYSRLFSEMLGTNTVVVCAEIDAEHPIVAANRAVMQYPILSDDFDEALVEVHEYFNFHAQVTKIREQAILERLPYAIEQAKEIRPSLAELQEVRPLKVLMWAGLMHRSISAALSHKIELEKSNGRTPSLELNEHIGFDGEYCSPYETQVYAKLVRGQEVSDDLIARTMLAKFVIHEGVSPNLTAAQYINLEEGFIATLSFAELKEFYDDYINDEIY